MDQLSLLSERPQRWFQSPAVLLSLFQSSLFLLLTVLSWSLTPSTCLLYSLGGTFAPDVALRKGGVRLVTGLLYHAGVVNLAVCVGVQVAVWGGVEKMYGRFQLILISLVSGTVGSLAAATYDCYAVIGCAGCWAFGLLGAKGASFVLKWNTEDKQRPEKVAFFATYVFIPFALTSLWPHSTIAGHLFSLLFSFSLCLSVYRSDFTSCGFRVALRVAAIVMGVVVVWYLSRELWYKLEYLDCDFVPYSARSGLTHYSGPKCETFCANY